MRKAFFICLIAVSVTGSLLAQTKKEREVNLDEVTVTAKKKADAAIGAKVTEIKQDRKSVV